MQFTLERWLVFTILWTISCAVFAQSEAAVPDGRIREQSPGRLSAWDAVNKQWVSLEGFWRNYAARRGGLTWGSRTEYPIYADVKEFDTMIINLPSGPCLMEFFHARWRRANDVRRWDDNFNTYGGCPNVFKS